MTHAGSPSPTSRSPRDARRGLPRVTCGGASGARRRAADARKEDADSLAAPGARAGARDRRRAGAGAFINAGGPPAPDGARERAAARARAGRGGAAPALVSVVSLSSSWGAPFVPRVLVSRRRCRPRRKLYQVLYLFAHLLADSSSPSLFEFLPEFRLGGVQGAC